MDLKKITGILKAKQNQAQDSTAAEMLKARAAKDTTKPYNREEFIQRINDITAGKIKLNDEKSDAKGKKTYKVKDKNGNDIEMSKEQFESFVKRRGGKIN
jgi:hypothetical protein